jgi:hypothetical protein
MITTRENGRTKAARSEKMQDILLISSFGFWAVLLGFFPVLALYTLTGS